MELILYGHDECSLCDRLEAMLAPHVAGRGLTLVKCNINDDPAWRRAYHDRIPVLTADGREILEGRPSQQEVDGAMAKLLS